MRCINSKFQEIQGKRTRTTIGTIKTTITTKITTEITITEATMVMEITTRKKAGKWKLWKKPLWLAQWLMVATNWVNYPVGIPIGVGVIAMGMGSMIGTGGVEWMGFYAEILRIAVGSIDNYIAKIMN